jgi:microcystin degradation protein MlrC
LGRGKASGGGAADVARAAGIELVPTTYACALSGPPVADDAYRALRARLLDGLSPLAGAVDGVYLSLHGAMMSESVEDTEGDILEAVRTLFGPDVPIAASFDLHTHFTAAMANATPLIAGFQTCPHIDLFETGARAMRLLVAQLSGARATLAYRKIRMMSSSEGHDTENGPVGAVMDRLHEIEQDPTVLDASMFLTQPWFDATDLGWATVVVTQDDRDRAQQYADELATMLWERRSRLQPVKTSIPAALERVRASAPGERPFVLSDCADSPSAGSTGDGVFLLEALLAEPLEDAAYLTVVDAPAVAACFAAGVNGEVSTQVGGTRSKEFFRPVAVSGRVETLCDGRYQGKYSPGPIDAGRTCVLAIGKLRLVITEHPVSLLDLQLFLRVGLDPSAAKIVQVKSAGGYRAYYGPLSHEMIDIDTTGPSGSDLTALPFNRPRRPLWPFDPDLDAPW